MLASEEVMTLVHAFPDKGRKDAIRALAARVAALEAHPVACTDCLGSGRAIYIVGGCRCVSDYPCQACAGIGRRLSGAST